MALRTNDSGVGTYFPEALKNGPTGEVSAATLKMPTRSHGGGAKALLHFIASWKSRRETLILR